MALKVTSLDQLDPALVEQLQAEFTQLLQEKFPEVEVIRGPNHDIVHFLAGGVSGGINQTEIQRVLDSRSLLAIETDPELADPDLVDHVLSNLLITRQIGDAAKGEITVVVEGATSVVLPANQLFNASGVEFAIDEPIVAKPPGSELLDPGDRLLEPRGDGTYEFTVPATAVALGEDGNIRRNTRLVPTPVFERFVTAFAANDFKGGKATEDNSSLLARKDEGIPAKVMQGRSNIVALIKAQPVFSNTKHFSIIGYGQAEMSRDRHWIFPVSGGGRIDIYARTDTLPKNVSVKKDCTLIEIQGSAQSVWQVSLTRDDAPGFYEVSQIRRPTDPADIAGFEVVSDVRGVDFDDDVYAPDIVTTAEGVYTRYQTAVIRFVDTETPTATLTVGDTAEYELGILAQPLLRELQNFANSGEHTNLMADTLIKGCIPCFLSINFEIVKSATETAPSLEPIRAAVADLVNKMNFPGEIAASQIADVVHDSLSGTMSVGPIDMHGSIRRIDGTRAVIRDQQVLRLPNSPSTLVTPRTTTFLLFPQDIGVSVRNRA